MAHDRSSATHRARRRRRLVVPAWVLAALADAARGAAADDVVEREAPGGDAAGESSGPASASAQEMDVTSIEAQPVPRPEAPRKRPPPAMHEARVRGKARGALSATSIQPLTIVRGQEARDTGARNAADALQEVPGLVTTGPHNQVDRARDVSIRGFDPGYTLVLVDGERVTSADGENRFDLSSLGIDTVDRIEVVKGPQALRYGSDAIGGVVNVITRPPGDRARAFASAGQGGLGTRRLAASLAAPLWSWGPRVRLFGRHERSDGFTDAHDLDRELRQITPRDDRRPTRRWELQADAWQDLGAALRAKLGLRLHGQDAFVERSTNRYTETGVETGLDARRDTVGTLRVEHGDPARGLTVASARLHHASFDRIRGRDATRQASGRFLHRELSIELQDIGDTLWLARIEHTRPLGEWQLLRVYAEGRHRRRASANDGRRQRLDRNGILIADSRTLRPDRVFDKTERYGVVGIEDELRLGAHAVSLGVRAEDTATWPGVVTPAASLQLALPRRLTLRLAAGLGYRVPEFALRTQSPVPELDLLGQKYTAGNPELRPERSRALQAVLSGGGARVAWAAGLHVTRLHDRIDKAIEDDYMGTGLPIERPVNIGRATTGGAELEARVRLPRGASLRGSYALLASRNHDSGARLNETPVHTGSVVLGGRVPWLGVEVTAFYAYIGERPRIDAVTGARRRDSPVAPLHNARVRIGRPLRFGLRVDLDIENALDVRWDRDNDGDSDLPPIRLFASLSGTFEASKQPRREHEREDGP